jgi:CheY-like chemotaxis protein
MQAVKKTSSLIKKMLLFTGQFENNRRFFALSEVVDSTIDLLKHGTDKKIDFKNFISGDNAWIHGEPDLFQTSLLNFLFTLLKITKRDILTIVLSIVDEYRSSSTGTFRFDNVSIKKLVILTIDTDLEDTEDWKKSDTFGELLSVVNSMNGKLITGSGSGNENVQINFPLSRKPPEPEQNNNGIQINKRILVIDDDKMVSNSTEEVLLSKGYTVIACNNAADALSVFRQNHQEIGLVLLDMRMPEMSGRDLYYELKRIDSFVRVIIVSGYCSDIDVQEMLKGKLLDNKFVLFNPDFEPVKNELAAVNNVIQQYRLPLSFGYIKNPEEGLNTLVKKMKTAGSDKIIEEMQKQLDGYLGSK